MRQVDICAPVMFNSSCLYTTDPKSLQQYLQSRDSSCTTNFPHHQHDITVSNHIFMMKYFCFTSQIYEKLTLFENLPKQC